jgi:C-5 cytosine-specific DNA methylase
VRPVCYDLYCGLGGWAEGFLSEGYRCAGFDLEAHDYGTGGYPGELILRDVRSIHGSELKDATCIVGSSPCQEFSYRAMPWKRAKALPPPYLGMELFNAQFRIQREASEAAGHHIPMVVENVQGAQKWVGRARWHYGSYYLWGDVPALMPMTLSAWFAVADSKERGVKAGDRSEDGKWSSSFADTLSAKVPGFRFDGSGKSFQSAAVKTVGHANIRDGHSHTRHLTNQAEHDAIKVSGPEAVLPGEFAWNKREAWQDARREAIGTKQGGDWFGANCETSMSRMYGSKSIKRKAASAMIAKIPFALSSHIAKSFKS